MQTALLAIGRQGDEMMDALDALPAAIYLTDPEGHITHYNRACVDLLGRTPEPGRDRWCASWKLYDIDGAPLPHSDCPMAITLRENREVRGTEAWAERPDGSRVRFAPFPTLIRNDDGSVAGAVNLLIGVTDRRRAADLRDQAERCRRLGHSALDRQTIDALQSMAREYDAEADRLSRAN